MPDLSHLTALLSVSDKTGVVALASRLHALGVKLLSTGGTAKLLAAEGLPVTEVADMTGSHTRKGQLRVLQQNGVRHTINAAGWPVVPMSAVDGTKAEPAEAPRWRSNAHKKAA